MGNRNYGRVALILVSVVLLTVSLVRIARETASIETHCVALSDMSGERGISLSEPA
jgi:hypothetical protein